MPYGDRKRREQLNADRPADQAGWLQRLSRGFLPRPAGGRLVGPVFRSDWLANFGVLPDEGKVADGTPHLSGPKLRELLAAAFAGQLPSAATQNAALRPADKFDDVSYYVPTLEELRRVVENRSTLRTNPRDAIFDCEDFAYALRADFARNRYQGGAAPTDDPFAVGIIWGERPVHLPHVVNVAAFHDVATRRNGITLIDTTPIAFEWIDPADWPVVDYIVI